MLNRKLVKIFVATSFAVILSSVESISLWGSNQEKLCDRRYLNDKIRIDGKVALVTGGTSGLGFVTAENLAKRGARVYLAARDAMKGKNAVESIQQSTGNINVKFIQLDLGSLASIRQFSVNFRAVENRLDILLCNAGVASSFKRTEDGFEISMGVNHLGHFLLTNLLLDMLKASAPSRIIVVSSNTHRTAAIIATNLNSELVYHGPYFAYSNSKLANILFTRELARRLENTGVTVNSLDPGFSVPWFLESRVEKKVLKNIFQNLKLRLNDPIQAAKTHIMLSVDPSVTGVSGKHFKNCLQAETSRFASDERMAGWLWDESAKLTRLYEDENVSTNLKEELNVPSVQFNADSSAFFAEKKISFINETVTTNFKAELKVPSVQFNANSSAYFNEEKISSNTIIN